MDVISEHFPHSGSEAGFVVSKSKERLGSRSTVLKSWTGG